MPQREGDGLVGGESGVDGGALRRAAAAELLPPRRRHRRAACGSASPDSRSLAVRIAKSEKSRDSEHHNSVHRGLTSSKQVCQWGEYSSQRVYRACGQLMTQEAEHSRAHTCYKRHILAYNNAKAHRRLAGGEGGGEGERRQPISVPLPTPPPPRRRPPGSALAAAAPAAGLMKGGGVDDGLPPRRAVENLAPLGGGGFGGAAVAPARARAEHIHSLSREADERAPPAGSASSGGPRRREERGELVASYERLSPSSRRPRASTSSAPPRSARCSSTRASGSRS